MGPSRSAIRLEHVRKVVAGRHAPGILLLVAKLGQRLALSVRVQLPPNPQVLLVLDRAPRVLLGSQLE
eukprot:7040790-Prymnesium_polylepis.1